MSDDAADFWEKWHHFWYHLIRGKVYEPQYVGTVRIGEEELEETLFHPTDARYNWLAYWKKHNGDGRDSTGSWKLRYPRHKRYVERGMQLHMTLFPARDGDGLDVYAHYEYDNVKHPIKHLKEKRFSARKGVTLARQYFRDNKIELQQTHD